MEAVTVMGALAFFPSSRTQCHCPPKSFTARISGLWCRRLRTHLPPFCASHTLDPHGGDDLVDVICIGSRKYSIIDFCLDSPSVSSSRFRFWTIYSRDQKKVQLLERCRSKDEVIRTVEFPLPQDSCQPTAILLASTGHGLDHIAAIDLLKNIKSVGGLAIAIVLKPFGFEGQRRQKEAIDLVNNLKSCLSFYVVVEADSFFNVEVGTFAEALEGANNNVILAMNTISSMIFKMHSMILDTPKSKIKDVKHSEVVKVLKRYGEVKIYHGDGYSVNAAIMHAIMHCPFFYADLKDFNGLVLLTLTCSCNIDDSDLPQPIHSFRQITGYTGDIILSKMCEPNLEQKLVITLLIRGRRNEKMVTQSKDSGNTSDLDLPKVAYSLEVIPDEEEFPDKLENVLLRKESYHETSRGDVEPVETSRLSDNKCIGQNSGDGIAVDMFKKNSLLSVRAAMMLETEREFSKSWNPIVDIQYRGGIYRGICQGGLPDGNGRLTSMDGSFYEGFWKCGKKSGLGTFCYSNGDLFRGLWRDDLMHGKSAQWDFSSLKHDMHKMCTSIYDLMHGKGWFYFHTGDRWFANFWRGKANGEGRFFSKNGSVFFGNFRDGWRHGQSVSIDADGSRWAELWDDGVLVDRTPLDKEADN